MSETATSERLFVEAVPDSPQTRHYKTLAVAADLCADASDIRAASYANIGDSETAALWRSHGEGWKSEAASWRAMAEARP